MYNEDYVPLPEPSMYNEDYVPLPEPSVYNEDYVPLPEPSVYNEDCQGLSESPTAAPTRAGRCCHQNFKGRKGVLVT